MLNMISPLEVGISCVDLPLLRNFYERVVGMQFISEFVIAPDKAKQTALTDSGYTVVRLQTPLGERIKLLSPKSPPSVPTQERYILDKANTAYFTFIVEDIEHVIQRFLDDGVEFLTGEQKVEVRPGVYLAFCKDPEGNILELVEYEDISAYRDDLNKRSK